MKTFSEFLTEALNQDSGDLKSDATAMWKALVFNRDDSDQVVYDTIKKIEKFWHLTDHNGFTLDGIKLLRKMVKPQQVFWMMEVGKEYSAETWESFGVDMDDDVMKTKSGRYVEINTNISSSDDDIEYLTDIKIKKIIKMMCDLHNVKYNPEVFRKYDAEDFTNDRYNPAS